VKIEKRNSSSVNRAMWSRLWACTDRIHRFFPHDNSNFRDCGQAETRSYQMRLTFVARICPSADIVERINYIFRIANTTESHNQTEELMNSKLNFLQAKLYRFSASYIKTREVITQAMVDAFTTAAHCKVTRSQEMRAFVVWARRCRNYG
jgi:hypothetical protein